MNILSGVWHRVVYAWNDTIAGRNEQNTWGARALIFSSYAPGGVLMVRHPYGDQTKWHLPGGGYNPRKETPEAAVLREVYEELGVRAEVVMRWRDYTIPKEDRDGNLNGAMDTVAPFVCHVPDLRRVRVGDEVAETAIVSVADLAAGRVDTYPISVWMAQCYAERLPDLYPRARGMGEAQKEPLVQIGCRAA